MLSIFSETGRDQFVRPVIGNGTGQSSFDAQFVNTARDAITAIETYTKNAVTLEPRASVSNNLAIVSQVWSGIVYSGVNTSQVFVATGNGVATGSVAVFTLPVSPVILEDSGVIPTQTALPTNPEVSLLSSANLDLIPTSWITRLSNSTYYMSACLLGASSYQTLSVTNIAFGVGSDNVSPQVTATVQLSHPQKYGLVFPSGTYYVSLVILRWV